MSAREREHGELPSPNLSLFSRKVGQGHFAFQILLGLIHCFVPGTGSLHVVLEFRETQPGWAPAFLILQLNRLRRNRSTSDLDNTLTIG